MAPSTSTSDTYRHWLIKAEPDSRIEKGVDVKFSIDDFEKCKVSSWEGVRNHQAKNYLKTQMKNDHLCLFYASNCKVPGVTGIAKVVKEGYPDHNAWDERHPYYDPKSKSDAPTWYMVDVEFVSRLPHLVPLALLQHLSTLDSPPDSLSYLSSSQLREIANSALLSRGRLSVQPVSDEFFQAVRALGENGGFDHLLVEIKTSKSKGKAKSKTISKQPQDEEKPKVTRKRSTRNGNERDAEEQLSGEEEEEEKPTKKARGRANASTRAKPSKRLKKQDDDEDGFPSESEEERMPTRGSSTRSRK
ncbi:EVE domain-containing protein [Sporobolomyces koalae]|uniref:EVE domain-containing protein n=1 Tax=Sporobolomyces koalae TaxID=500713 RepID=UPI0031816A39